MVGTIVRIRRLRHSLLLLLVNSSAQMVTCVLVISAALAIMGVEPIHAHQQAMVGTVVRRRFCKHLQTCHSSAQMVTCVLVISAALAIMDVEPIHAHYGE